MKLGQHIGIQNKMWARQKCGFYSCIQTRTSHNPFIVVCLQPRLSVGFTKYIYHLVWICLDNVECRLNMFYGCHILGCVREEVIKKCMLYTVCCICCLHVIVIHNCGPGSAGPLRRNEKSHSYIHFYTLIYKVKAAPVPAHYINYMINGLII